MTKAYFLVSLAFLSACTTAPVEKAGDSGLPADIRTSSLESLQKKYRLCFKSLGNDPELKGIANKVTLEAMYEKDPNFELMRIEDVPTADERSIIRKWAAKLGSCYKIKAESYAYLPSDVAGLSATADSEQQILVMALSRGKLTYGQFTAEQLGVDSKYKGLILRAMTVDQKPPQPLRLHR